MPPEPVTRTTLALHSLDGDASFARVEVRRITIAPDVAPGAHWHNGPVFGVIESGSVRFQVAGDEETSLRAGDTFYEPGNTTISRFDATADGVTFLAWFPLDAEQSAELTLGAAPPHLD